MDTLGLIRRVLSELGAAAWLMAQAVRGGVLDLVERDELARARLAAALDTFVWRPLPTLMALAALVGVIVGVSAANVLRLYHAELAVGGGLAIAMVREILPVLIGVFAAGRVAVELAARLGGMRLGRELEALEAMGLDPGRYVLTPALIAVVLAAPVHTVAAVTSAFLSTGLVLQQDALVPWPNYFELTLTPDVFRATLTGMGKSLLFFLIAAGVGAAAGSRVERGPRAVGLQATSAFTAGLLGVLAAAALWTALA